MKILNFILRLALGGIFVYAGAGKIIDPAGFATDIGNYRLLPHDWIHLMAITLPWIEVVAGLLLILGVWKRASALLITLMLVAFIAAIGQAVARNLNIECGCFGTVGGRQVGLIAIAEDVAMLAAALWLTWREKDSPARQTSAPAAPC
jgi:putative oxidoreductase